MEIIALRRSGKRGSHKTHYALSQAGETDNGNMTQANSIGPAVAHWFPMEESAGTTLVTDIVGGVEINETQTNTDIADGTVGKSVNILTGAVQTIVGNWEKPGDKDVLIVSCFQSKFAGVEPGDGGFGEFAFGNSTDSQLRVQPYYSIYVAGGEGILATPVYKPYLVRTTDQDVICAAWKSGDKIGHHVDGIFTGESNSVTLMNSTAQNAFNDFQPSDIMAVGHAAYAQDICLCPEGDGVQNNSCGAPCANEAQWINRGGQLEIPSSFLKLEGNASKAGDFAQDYYGLLVMVFENGLPSIEVINEALLWMKDDWVNLPAGEKRIAPGLVSFT